MAPKRGPFPFPRCAPFNSEWANIRQFEIERTAPFPGSYERAMGDGSPLKGMLPLASGLLCADL